MPGVNTGGGITWDRVQDAAMRGNAYRVTPEPTAGNEGFALDDGESFTVRINPQESSGTVHIQTPNINPQDRAVVDVYEDADPLSTADDLIIHNQRYDQGVGNEVPNATIQRVPDGQLDVSDPADRTEHRLIRNGEAYSDTPGPRVFWRTVPFTDDISIRITDRSGGTANELDFALVLFEGNLLPD